MEHGCDVRPCCICGGSNGVLFSYSCPGLSITAEWKLSDNPIVWSLKCLVEILIQNRPLLSALFEGTAIVVIRNQGCF